MRKGVKITIVMISFLILVIAFLGMCYFIYYKDNQLSKYHTSIGEKLLYSQKTPEAIEELEKALELSPRNTHAEKVLLEIYLNNKQYKKAIAMQLSQLQRAPDEIWDFKRNKRLGEIYLVIGDINNAKNIYESLVTKYSKTPGSYLGLAICYEKGGYLERAIEYQKQGITLMKTDYKFTPVSALKQELQKLSDLYKKSGQEELANNVLQETANIK